jgi:hypothetical protein
MRALMCIFVLLFQLMFALSMSRAPRRMSWFDYAEGYDFGYEIVIDYDDCRGYDYIDTRVKNYTSDHTRIEFGFTKANVLPILLPTVASAQA